MIETDRNVFSSPSLFLLLLEHISASAMGEAAAVAGQFGDCGLVCYFRIRLKFGDLNINSFIFFF